ncbi:right-handed parallel beta-helix repeat-containing protein [Dyella sp. 7MK23]|uniref:Right-handed parallel beta-helix repeat-containing protein n=1 Tax=Dyella acidiphila TaxID=2775866 RepID=A0ABR9GA39_9GAMM|nr:glycosyl hydrolase family 28-related protein [Dyella acidiphila]MBE1160906.1 right-handed parallel beta-helix repeat-containing protein [Dyella acidiphila]
MGDIYLIQGKGMERRSFIQGASVIAAMALATEAKAQTISSTDDIAVITTIADLQAATSATLTQSQCIVMGYVSETDGGGGIFATGVSASANGGTIINDASGRSWYRNCNPSVVKAEWFGASANGSTDSTAAINAALASQASDVRVDLAPGTYVISGSVLISGNYKSLVGAAQAATVLACSAASSPVVSVAGGSISFLIRDMTVMHSGTPTNGGHGISCTGTVSQSRIENIISQNNSFGFSLAATDLSFVKGCISQSNFGYGFYQTNSPANPGSQWYYEDCLAQENGQAGYFLTSSSGSSSMSVGAFSRCLTFANSGCGFVALGLATSPIQGVRISDCFFGQDANNEVFLDTYGGAHSVRNTFTELAGTGKTGPAQSDPASNGGCGIFVSSNNQSVDITSCYCGGHSQNGIYSQAVTANVTGCSAFDNGRSNLAGEQCGIHHEGGRMIVSGGSIGNTVFGGGQQCGIRTYNGANTSIGFVDLTGNVASATLADSNPSSLMVVGCLGV